MQTHLPPLLPNGKRGYVLLISVLITGAIAASISVALLTFGAAFAQSALVSLHADQARSLVDACVEEAFIRLQRDTAYVGGETLTITDQQCTIVAVLGSGATNREIHVEATVGRSTQRARVVVSAVDFPLVISSWERVADF